MSSFSKNLIPRRIHKERSQPLERVARHGLLEKKQDYKQRAKHFNRKTARIKLLREKGSFRNPDEFYFAMQNASTRDGVVRRVVDKAARDAVPLGNRSRDERLLAETQDSRYVTHKLSVEDGRISTLKKRLHFVGAAQRAERKHVIFVDDDDEVDEVVKRQVKRQAEQTELLNVEGDGDGQVEESMHNKQEKAYSELDQHADRRHKLSAVFQDMGVEKKLMTKGRRVLVKPSDKRLGIPPVFRWLQERSR